MDRMNQESQSTNQKYDIKRKALKDLETSLKQQTSKMETEKAVLLEKHKNLEL